MQSGISASEELQSAFRSFTSDPSLFALPVTIKSEALAPLDPIPLSGSFTSSLPSLQSHLQPKTPIYLLLRKDDGTLVAVTYIPSISPVRSKTLFASTRASLVRELGTEKFGGGTIFVTEPEEVLDPREWAQRERSSGGEQDERDQALLTREERELGSVKRAEEEERFGTGRRDLMTYGAEPKDEGEVGGQGRLAMKTTPEAREALQSALAEAGSVVVLGIDIPTETINLHSKHNSVSTSALSSKIPSSQPSYTFYHYPQTSTVLFVYTCPAGMPIKQRMLYASSRNSVLLMAKSEGVEIAKRIEAGAPDEIDDERISGEMDAPTPSESGTSTPVGGAKGGFARPKRPGRR